MSSFYGEEEVKCQSDHPSARAPQLNDSEEAEGIGNIIVIMKMTLESALQCGNLDSLRYLCLKESGKRLLVSGQSPKRSNFLNCLLPSRSEQQQPHWEPAGEGWDTDLPVSYNFRCVYIFIRFW